MPTPEEIRANIAANLKSIQAVAAAKAAGSATGTEDESGEGKLKSGAKPKVEPKEFKEARNKAQDLSEKCMKAVGDLKDHVHASANDEAFTDAHKSSVEKAHKAMKAAHSALMDGTMPADDDKEGEKAALAAATKALEDATKAMTAAPLGPRSAGAGGVAATAGKGLGIQPGAQPIGVPALKAIGDMTAPEREAAALDAIRRSRGYGMSAGAFDKTGNEVLKAFDQLAQTDGAAAVQV